MKTYCVKCRKDTDPNMVRTKKKKQINYTIKMFCLRD